MYRSMNLKGFLAILGVMLLIFLIVHSVLQGAVNNKAEEEKMLRIQKTRLEEENKDLSNRLDVIRFEFTNPEALYAYTEEELQILMDEMND